MADNTSSTPVPVRCTCGYQAQDLKDAERHKFVFGSPGHDLIIGDGE